MCAAALAGVAAVLGAGAAASPAQADTVAVAMPQRGLVTATPLSSQIMGIHVEGGWLLR